MPTIGSAYCEHCKKQVVAKKKGCNHMLHLVLTLITAGFWLIIWLLCAITWDDWYCNECGGHVKLGSKEPKTRCPECNTVIPPESSFCPHCGKTTGLICPKCKTKNSANSIYCKNCGNKLG